MPRNPEVVRHLRCPHCWSRLYRVVAGNIIHWTHNPADGNGHICPPETGEH